MPKAPSPLLPICCLPPSSTLTSLSFLAVSCFSSEEPECHKKPSSLCVTHCLQPSLRNLELNCALTVWVAHLGGSSHLLCHSDSWMAFWMTPFGVHPTPPSIFSHTMTMLLSSPAKVAVPTLLWMGTEKAMEHM